VTIYCLRVARIFRDILSSGTYRWGAWRDPNLTLHRRASESRDAGTDPPPYAVNERFLKKIGALVAALCLHFAHDNF